MDLGTLMTTFGANLSPLQAAVVKAVSELEKFDKEGRKALESINTASVKTASAMDNIATAVKIAAAAFGVYKIAEYAKDAALAAARFETLGIVMTTVGKNSGYTSTQMEGFATALQKTGISMTESYSVITKMAQAQLDLTKSTELARVAQDAAVIGNLNSSDALARMVQGIQSAEVEILRTIGINVSFEDSYTKLADKLGKTSKELTVTEKTTARLNAVLAAGPAIAGVYEASMDTASKQLKTMERYAADLQVMLGKVFTPALSAVVGQINEQWKAFNADVKKSEQTIREWGVTVLDVVNNIVQGFGFLISAVYSFRSAFGTAMEFVGKTMSSGLQQTISDVEKQIADIDSNGVWSRIFGYDAEEAAAKRAELVDALDTMKKTQSEWNVMAKGGEEQAKANDAANQALANSVQELSQKIQYAGSVEKKALADKKTAIDNQTSSEMTLKGIAEQRWQSEQKQASDKKYKDYLDNTTDSIVQQTKEYEKLVAKLKKDPVYEAYVNSGQQDAADAWLKQKIDQMKDFDSQGAKSEKAAQKLAIALQEMHSKFAESESDEYAKGIADLDKEYLKLQQSLKGSAEGLEELDKWYNKKHAELAFKKDIETLTTLNEKLKDADNQLNQLSMTTEAYAQYSIDVEFENQMTALMALNEVTGTYSGLISELIDKYTQIRDLKKAKAFLSEEDTEIYLKMQDALQDVDDKIAQLTMSSKEYSEYSLARQFEKDMTAALAGGYATEEYRKKLEEYYKLVKKTNQTLKKEIEQIYEQMWKNIQSTFADTIYDMFDKGIDGFSGFFDKVMELFKKMLAQMIAAWIASGIKGMFTGYGLEGFSLGSLFGSTDSATGTASSAMSLASLAKSLWELPETIASIPEKLVEFLGLSSSVPSASIAGGNLKLATTVDELISAYLGEEAVLTSFGSWLSSTSSAVLGLGESASVAGTSLTSSAHSLSSVMLESQLSELAAGGTVSSSANLLGALEGGLIAGIISFGANVLPGLIGGGDKNIDLMYELKKWEVGYTNITKETADLYKTMLLGISDQMTYLDESAFEQYDWNKIDAWIAANQEFLKITTADIDRLLKQQEEINSGVVDSGALSSASGYLANELTMQATVDVAIKMAQDEGSSVSQKMYQLGFIANKAEGGWESEAVTKMIAEFKNQGVAWEDINNAMLNYGATDADYYKRIYAEYHGDSVLTDLESLTAALSAQGISEDVLKTIKYIYETNIPLDQMQALLEWAGLSSEEAARIVGQIDPSDEWKDLVIPVDAPDSIPVDYSGLGGGMARGGPVSAGTPYIIGEVGPELFVPQESGHILSNANMKKLMGMGIKGFADGTTDTEPLPGTPEWWAKYPPSDGDLGQLDTGNPYESLMDWQSEYEDKLKELLGLNTDLGDAIDELNTYYVEQIKWATELGASQEQLAQLAKDQQAAKESILKDWLANEIDYYNEMMGLNTELGDTLSDVASHYDTAIREAQAAGATEEQLAEIRKAQMAVTEKALQDWLAGEIDYYNQMMGLNTELGSALDEVSSHYDTAIEEAKAAGATEEQLAEIRKAQMSVTEKILKDWLDNEIDYYNEMMGISTQYGDTLKGIAEHYEKAIEEAKAAGATEEQLAEIRKAQMAVTEKATKDWAKSTMSSMLDVWESMLKWAQDISGMTEQQMALSSLMIYRAKEGFSAKGFEDILNIDGMNSDQVEAYVGKLAEYANAVASALQATYDALKNVKDAIAQNIQDILNGSKSNEQLVNDYAQQILEGWNALAGLSAEDMPGAIEELREQIMDYYDLQKKLIEEKYKAEEEKFADEIEMIEKIRDKIQELTYSSYNIAGPKAKVESAAGDYESLLAAAKTGDKDAIEKYLAFINTYLQSAQDAYKSSSKYQEIYDQVMRDLAGLDTQPGKSIEELTEELNKLTEENTKKMQEELDALAKLTTDALKALGEKTDATMNNVVDELKKIFDLLTAWVIAIYGSPSSVQGNSGYADGGIASGPYSGYQATLHGTEAIIPLRGGSVPVVVSGGGGGSDDPETKALLKQLVAQGKQKQRVTLALDNGSELSGYIRSEADAVRVAANARGGVVNRRLFR